MQKPGEKCSCCQDRWINKGKKPRTLLKAPTTSQNHNMILALCPFCDGDAFDQATTTAVRREQGLPDFPLADDDELGYN